MNSDTGGHERMTRITDALDLAVCANSAPDYSVLLRAAA
jgi:hypothetical protein